MSPNKSVKVSLQPVRTTERMLVPAFTIVIMIDIVSAQVRIWNVERSQKEIINNMRLVDGIAGQPGLVAYWKFDDPNMCVQKTLGMPCHACMFNALTSLLT